MRKQYFQLTVIEETTKRIIRTSERIGNTAKQFQFSAQQLELVLNKLGEAEELLNQ